MANAPPHAVPLRAVLKFLKVLTSDYAVSGTASSLTQSHKRIAPHGQITLGPEFPARIPGPKPPCVIY